MIQAAGVVGFDTESKPVFTKGGKSDGPHVVQIAAEDEGRADEARRVEETARNVASAANDYNDRETCSVASNPGAS